MMMMMMELYRHLGTSRVQCILCQSTNDYIETYFLSMMRVEDFVFSPNTLPTGTAILIDQKEKKNKIVFLYDDKRKSILSFLFFGDWTLAV